MSLARSWIAWNKIRSTKRMIGVAFASASTSAARLVTAQCHQLAGFAELLEDVLHAGGVGPVIAFDSILDLLRRRNDDVDVFAEREAQIFRGAQIERIDQRDCENVFAKRRSAEHDAGGRDRSESIVEFPAAISRSARSTNSVPSASAIADKIRAHRRSRYRPSPGRWSFRSGSLPAERRPPATAARTCCSTKRSATCWLFIAFS